MACLRALRLEYAAANSTRRDPGRQDAGPPCQRPLPGVAGCGAGGVCVSKSRDGWVSRSGGDSPCPWKGAVLVWCSRCCAFGRRGKVRSGAALRSIRGETSRNECWGGPGGSGGRSSGPPQTVPSERGGFRDRLAVDVSRLRWGLRPCGGSRGRRRLRRLRVQ